MESKKHVQGFVSKRIVLLVAVFQSFAKSVVRMDLEVGSYSTQLTQGMSFINPPSP